MMPDFSKMMGMMSGGKQTGFEDSDFTWTDEAKSRVEQVPAGFMRNMTMQRVEEYAKNNGHSTITLDVAEAGLAQSKSMMSSMMGADEDTPTDPNAMDIDEQPTAPEPAVAPVSSPVEDGVDYYYCEMCGYTVKGHAPDECPICLAAKEKFRLITADTRSTFLTETSGKVMRWEKGALVRLENIPEGFMRDMTKWRIEMAARKSSILTITEEVMDDKYKYWGEGSKDVTTQLKWEDEALERINRIPGFVRGMVQKEIERHTRAQNSDIVTAEILSQVRDKWEMGEEFHSDIQDLEAK